jgi:hypothetical protein
MSARVALQPRKSTCKAALPQRIVDTCVTGVDFGTPDR